MQVRFRGEVVAWRGPAPYRFVAFPPGAAAEVAALAAAVTYGWGAVPVTVEVGSTVWTTSLFPRDGGHLLPVKDAVRRAEGLDVGGVADVLLTVDPSRRR